MTEIGLRSVTHQKLVFRAYIPLNCSQGTHFETDWNTQQVVNEILLGVYTHSDFYYWLHIRCRFGRRICHGIIMISVALTFFLVLLIHKGKLFQQRNFRLYKRKKSRLRCSVKYFINDLLGVIEGLFVYFFSFIHSAQAILWIMLTRSFCRRLLPTMVMQN